MDEEQKSISSSQSDGHVQESDKEDNKEYSFLHKVGLFFIDLIKIIILASITIGLVRYFLFKPFYVKGESMEPSFYEHDYLIIDELSYRFRDPARGEIIVFNAPGITKDHYLKRIIGLPGERIKIEGGKVIIYNNDNPQGMVMNEAYIEGDATPGSVSISLGVNQYFVMGDNRNASYDSRNFGPIDRDTLVGRVWVRGWPFSRLGFIEHGGFALQ